MNDDEDLDSSSSCSEDDGSTLDSSVLGTKEYWDSAYSKELENFAEIGDEGTNWFGEDATRRVVKWLNNTNLNKEKSLVLDLGSGNGSTLLSLAASGWRRLTGVDYSGGAVKLAASIAKRKVEDGWLKDFSVLELTGDEEEGEEEETTTTRTLKQDLLVQRLIDAAPFQNSSLCPYLAFAVYDITITPSTTTTTTTTYTTEVMASNNNTNTTTPSSDDLSSSLRTPQFDVILDKGTFDAISLCPEEADRKKGLYVDFVRTLLKGEEDEEAEGGRGGFFCLTSCNWTRDELVKTFGQYFTLHDRIEFPSFRFGGKTGSTVTSLVFKKNKVCS